MVQNAAGVLKNALKNKFVGQQIAANYMFLDLCLR